MGRQSPKLRRLLAVVCYRRSINVVKLIGAMLRNLIRSFTTIFQLHLSYVAGKLRVVLPKIDQVLDKGQCLGTIRPKKICGKDCTPRQLNSASVVLSC